MIEIEIDHYDLLKIQELNSKIANIIELYSTRNKYGESYYAYKKSYALPDFDNVKFKKLRLDMEVANLDYFNAHQKWKSEMQTIITKYNYITLKNFLIRNPLPRFGTNPTYEFAVNVKILAQLFHIPILQTLYSGDPKMINNYPESWLQSIFKKVNCEKIISNIKIEDFK